MGKVAAGNKEHAAAQLFRAVPDHHAQAVVIGQRQAGNADPDNFEIRIFFPDKIQRDHDAVVQRDIRILHGTRRKILPSCRVGQGADHFRVIIRMDSDMAGPELGE